VRDALKALATEAGGNTILKIRAFVAGSGDVRRVRDLVSEGFADRRQPLPALSLVPMRGAAARRGAGGLEAIAGGKKAVNPHGLAFFSARRPLRRTRSMPWRRWPPSP